MSRFGHTKRLPVEDQEIHERACTAAMFSQLAPHKDAWFEFHPHDDYEALRGPDEPPVTFLTIDEDGNTIIKQKWSNDHWIALDDIQGDYLRDRDVDFTVYVDYEEGLDFYFMSIDVLRHILKSVSTWGEIRFMMDACDVLDEFCAERVIGWHMRKKKRKGYLYPDGPYQHPSAYERLYREFMEAEVRATTVPLIRVATFSRRKE